jgi:hypothetical protein
VLSLYSINLVQILYLYSAVAYRAFNFNAHFAHRDVRQFLSLSQDISGTNNDATFMETFNSKIQSKIKRCCTEMLGNMADIFSAVGIPANTITLCTTIINNILNWNGSFHPDKFNRDRPVLEVIIQAPVLADAPIAAAAPIAIGVASSAAASTAAAAPIAVTVANSAASSAAAPIVISVANSVASNASLVALSLRGSPLDASQPRRPATLASSQPAAPSHIIPFPFSIARHPIAVQPQSQPLYRPPLPPPLSISDLFTTCANSTDPAKNKQLITQYLKIPIDLPTLGAVPSDRPASVAAAAVLNPDDPRTWLFP